MSHWRHGHSLFAGFALGVAASHQLLAVAVVALAAGVAGGLLVAAALAGVRRLRARPARDLLAEAVRGGGPWEHSEWFRPYVAAYYASVYLGEELSREETLARLDELLALELAAPAQPTRQEV